MGASKNAKCEYVGAKLEDKHIDEWHGWTVKNAKKCHSVKCGMPVVTSDGDTNK